MEDLSPLDHYYIELKDSSLGVVVGNWHTSYCIIGYLKYSATNRETPWCRRSTCYERLVNKYSPSIVRKYTSQHIYIPFFDNAVPCIPNSSILKIYNPVERSRGLLSSIRDALERISLELLENIIINTNVLPGITGSLLPRIHSVTYSDIDFVVYGFANSREVIEYVQSNPYLFKPLSGDRFKKWCANLANYTGLSPSDISKFYRNWRRGIFKEKEYSLIYNDGIYRDVMLLPSYRTVGVSKLIVELEGGIYALNYPSKSRVLKYRVLESNCHVPYDVVEVLSFEALYIPGLYEGGLFEVSGLLQCDDHENLCRLMIGGVEHQGYMKYYIGG
ncbi:MAG: hypothetical protein QXE81_05505 [Desulfurococcaceae archaeon]